MKISLRSILRSAVYSVDHFFFEKISASGFGLMRCVWGLTVFLFHIEILSEVRRYYSNDGLIPPELGDLVFRNHSRFTILDTVTEPTAVLLLFIIMILAAFLAFIGLWPRFSTLLCLLLLFSFGERNLQILAGGDTVLRLIGFLLVISPQLDAFSVKRAHAQWKHWKQNRTLLPPLTTYIWPYRLMLWQLIVIYTYSSTEKLRGQMWNDGTAIEAIFHHTHFNRFPMVVMDFLSSFSAFFTHFWIVWSLSWALLLVPRFLWKRLPQRIQKHSLKRWLIFFGFLGHGMIFVLMEVGAFSIAMFTAYIGILLDRDFVVLRNFFNRFFKGTISILYDGHCILCRRSAFVLQMIDNLSRIQLVDFRDTKKKNAIASDISLESLDRALHIRTSKGRTESGFYAFRYLSWHIPILWITIPFWYIPGVPFVGKRVYARISESRNKCADGVCKHI